MLFLTDAYGFLKIFYRATREQQRERAIISLMYTFLIKNKTNFTVHLQAPYKWDMDLYITNETHKNIANFGQVFFFSCNFFRPSLS